MIRVASFAAAALIAAAIAAPAQAAYEAGNGVSLNGGGTNGIARNGGGANGTTDSAATVLLQGVTLPGGPTLHSPTR